jgi:hypothetical protein
MFWTKVIEKIKTHILCSITFSLKSHRLWDNVEKYSGDRGATNDVTTWRIRFACWICKATCTYAYAHTHALGYPHARTHEQACTHRPICNTAFPHEKWLRERASTLRYVYIACLVKAWLVFCLYLMWVFLCLVSLSYWTIWCCFKVGKNLLL